MIKLPEGLTGNQQGNWVINEKWACPSVCTENKETISIYYTKPYRIIQCTIKIFTVKKFCIKCFVEFTTNENSYFQLKISQTTVEVNAL